MPGKVRVQAIVQARMGSSRLPGKSLIPIEGRPVLYHVLDRVRRSRVLDRIVVATTDQEEDKILVEQVQGWGIPCYRGDSQDVLSRFYFCLKEYPAEIVVRITADDPLKEKSLIDKAVKILQSGNYDYVSNTLKPTFPEGLDVEVFTSSSLEKAYQEATLPSEREHVTPFIWKNPHFFSLHNFCHISDLSHWRWTLDTEEDLKFIKEVYRSLYREGEYFSFSQVVDFIKAHPYVSSINSGIARNAGYLLSLKKDQEEYGGY